MSVIEIPDCMRLVKSVHSGASHEIEELVEWSFEKHDDAETTAAEMAASDLSYLLNSVTCTAAENINLRLTPNATEQNIADPLAFTVGLLVAYDTPIGSEPKFEPLCIYEIHHVERKTFYDEDSVKRHFYEYRDMKIYPNKKNNRFRVYDETGFKFLRHHVDTALNDIDTLLLAERMRKNA